MNNAEQKLHELRNQLDHLDTSTMHTRVVRNLRSAWQEQHSNSTNSISMEHVPDPTTTPRNNWRLFGLTFGGLSLAGLALITTLVINTGDISSPTTTQQVALSNTPKDKKDKPTSTVQLDSADVGLSDNAILGSGINLRDIDLPDFEVPLPDGGDYDPGFGVEPTEKYVYDDITPNETEQKYSYTEDEESKQVFSESVGLTIEVKDDLLEIMNTLRTEVTNRNGYLVNISYYNKSGTINIQIPADQLPAFEETLSGLDADHTVEVNQYNVQNVSSEVVAMDEYIKTAEEQITELEELIASNETSSIDREDAKEQLDITKEILEESKVKRTEEIAKYSLVNVSVYVEQYESFWEGNYYQYDRSTFSGLVKYELGRAIYSLIRSTGKVTTFFVWLAVYSAIFVPAFLILRGIVRKIRRSMRKSGQ